MQAFFRALTISYKTASLQLREKMSLSHTEASDFMLKARETFGLQELMAVSTCNRTEIYYSSQHDLSKELLKLWAIEKGQPITPDLFEAVLTLEGIAAVRHLFRVSLGLESQVVGDLQITNQVKRAYQLCADLQMAGPYLHRLMHAIFFTNKKVVQDTALRDGAASVSYATVEAIEELTFGRPMPRVLVVGLGEIGADVTRNLASSGFTNVVVTNRTLSKAEALAQECGVQFVTFDQVWQEVATADVVVSAVSGTHPFFTKERISQLDLVNFKVMMDLSVPRSIEEGVENITGIILQNIDDIHGRTNEALQRRLDSIPEVEAIIEAAIKDFEEWSKEMVFSPAIQQFKNALEAIRKEEMARYMKQLDEQEAEKLDKITQNIMNKIVKLPVLQLKAACRRGDAENLAEVLQDLFNLEKAQEKK